MHTLPSSRQPTVTFLWCMPCFAIVCISQLNSFLWGKKKKKQEACTQIFWSFDRERKKYEISSKKQCKSRTFSVVELTTKDSRFYSPVHLKDACGHWAFNKHRLALSKATLELNWVWIHGVGGGKDTDGKNSENGTSNIREMNVALCKKCTHVCPEKQWDPWIYIISSDLIKPYACNQSLLSFWLIIYSTGKT